MADKVHIGAGSLSLEAFVSVVLGRGALVLDEASLAKLAPTTSVAPAPPPRPSASAPILLSKLQSRAVALAAALQLQQGRSGASAEAVRALGAALVSGSLPALDAAGDVAAQLAATAAAPSPGDVAAFRSISAPAVGVAALAIFGVQASLLPADAIAALSIEALRGSAVPFDSDFSEHARPVAGCVASASTLRLMLEGSRWAGRAATVAAAAAAAAPKAGKAGKGAPTAAAAPAATVPAPVTPALASVDDSDAVVCVHQLHGAAHAGVAAAARTLAVELSASLPAGGAPSAPGTPVPRLHLQALLAAIGEAREAAGTLLAASSERLRLLRIAAAAAATATDASAAAAVHDASVGLATLSSGRIAALAGFRGPRTEEPLTDAASSRADALSAALQLQALVDALIAGLAAEAAAAEALISASEAPAAVEAAEKDARKAAAAAAREAAEALRVAAMSAEGEQCRQKRERHGSSLGPPARLPSLLLQSVLRGTPRSRASARSRRSATQKTLLPPLLLLALPPPHLRTAPPTCWSSARAPSRRAPSCAQPSRRSLPSDRRRRSRLRSQPQQPSWLCLPTAPPPSRRTAQRRRRQRCWGRSLPPLWPLRLPLATLTRHRPSPCAWTSSCGDCWSGWAQAGPSARRRSPRARATTCPSRWGWAAGRG